MNLTNLLNGYRRSEPAALLILKLFMMIILLACLTGYLVIVIIDIIQDAPIIITSFTSQDSLRPPSK